MANKRDYYEILGVTRTSASSEIAQAYRKLAVKYHPDKNPGDDEAVRRFKEAAEAFEVLSDDDKRSRYDRYGHAGLESAGAEPHFNDINDIFDHFSEVFGDGLFGDLFGGGGRRGRGRRSRRGADVRCDLTLDLFEAARGVTKVAKFNRHERCAACQGSGAKAGTQPEPCRYCGGHGQVVQSSGIFRVQTTCPACHGAGTVIKEKCPDCRGEGVTVRQVEHEVKIPAGVDTGTRLRLSGEGDPSLDGGPPGDCYCVITVKEHALFRREGPHLVCTIPITYPQAALGATIEVPTLDGKEEMAIPAGTQGGDVFRLRGRGMTDLRHRGKGDLVVQVDLEVPKQLSDKQRQLLRELAEEEHSNVSPERKSFFETLKEYFIPGDDDKGA